MADSIREALEHAAKELDLAAGALDLCSSYGAAQRASDAATLARTALAADPPAPALDPSDFQTFQGIALDIVESLRPIVIPEILGVLRKAIEQPPAPAQAAEGPAVPDEVREAFTELERREQNLRVFRNVRAAMDADLPAQPPAPVPASEGERLAFAQWLDRRGAMADLGVRDSYFRAAALLRQPAPAPVPVTERPWEQPGWCDAEGRCWWFCPEAIMPNGALPYWAFGHLEHPKSWLTHCLPHWAIPQPPQCGEAQ